MDYSSSVASIENILSTIHGKVVTLEKKDVDCNITMIFEDLELHCGDYVYDFSEKGQAFVSYRIFKHRIVEFEIGWGYIKFDMDNGDTITLCADVELN